VNRSGALSPLGLYGPRRTDGEEQALEVLAAGTTRLEVCGDARVAAGRYPGTVVNDEIDVDVKEAQRLLASHVAGVGCKEVL
jgi:hypothetical protein